MDTTQDAVVEPHVALIAVSNCRNCGKGTRLPEDQPWCVQCQTSWPTAYAAVLTPSVTPGATPEEQARAARATDIMLADMFKDPYAPSGSVKPLCSVKGRRHREPKQKEAEYIDANRTVWTRYGFTTADGRGESFGPGHRNVPAVIVALREGRDPAATRRKEASQ